MEVEYHSQHRRISSFTSCPDRHLSPGNGLHLPVDVVMARKQRPSYEREET